MLNKIFTEKRNYQAVLVDKVTAFIKTQTTLVRRVLAAAAVEVVIEHNIELIDETPAYARPNQATLAVTHLDDSQRIAILQLTGPLNINCYDEIIATVQALVDSGTHYIILDLSDVGSVGISAMVIVYNIAAILRGQKPLGLEDGWATLRTVAHSLADEVVQDNFKLLNPQPHVRQTLENAGLGAFLEHDSNLESAVASSI